MNETLIFKIVVLFAWFVTVLTALAEYETDKVSSILIIIIITVVVYFIFRIIKKEKL